MKLILNQIIKNLKKDKFPSRVRANNTGPCVIKENVLYCIVVNSDFSLLLVLVRCERDKVP